MANEIIALRSFHNHVLSKVLAQEMSDFSNISRIGFYLGISVIVCQDSPPLTVFIASYRSCISEELLGPLFRFSGACNRGVEALVSAQ
jgi:hypothetical protein